MVPMYHVPINQPIGHDNNADRQVRIGHTHYISLYQSSHTPTTVTVTSEAMADEHHDDLEERMMRAQMMGDGDDGDGGGIGTGIGTGDDPARGPARDGDGQGEGAPDQGGARGEGDAPDPQELLRRHQQQEEELRLHRDQNKPFFRVHYSALSVLSAVLLIVYALRTRGQAYLGLTYLTSSKLAYVVIGNAIIAGTLSFFHLVVGIFLRGLRPTEAEQIGEKVRWNVTETCIALTIFRSEVDVNMGGMFLLLVFGKCLHWAAEMRGSHLRMTEEAFYFDDPSDPSSTPGEGGMASWAFTILYPLLPRPIAKRLETMYYLTPGVPAAQAKFLALAHFLLILDVLATAHCGLKVAKEGPSVHILFGFEGAILATSALSTISTYNLHIIDGCMHIMRRAAAFVSGSAQVSTDEPTDGGEDSAGDGEGEGDGESPAAVRLAELISSGWRSRRATLSFSIELTVRALRFLFYLLFFAIVFTYYGLPINIFREVYSSYQQLRERLMSFASYRRLTADMNERFVVVTSDEELDEVGRTCIICRDSMDSRGSCLKLPGCGHCFHAHCLQEWLTQQQTCPTCRGDIQANERKARADRAASEREMAAAEEDAAVEGEGPTADGDGGGDAPATEISNVPLSAHDSPQALPESREASSPFPCLYRVTAKSPGAKVHRLVNGGGIARMIPEGKIVLCTSLQFSVMPVPNLNYYGDDEGAVTGMMARTPDGWVSESDLERLGPLLRNVND